MYNGENSSMPFSETDGLKVLSDASSIEIISKNGEFAFSTNAFFKKSIRKVTIESEEKVIIDQLNIRSR